MQHIYTAKCCMLLNTEFKLSPKMVGVGDLAVHSTSKNVIDRQLKAYFGWESESKPSVSV